MLGKTEDRRRRTTEDEVVGWHHQLNGHEFEQTWGDSEGQRSLARCSPWGHRVGQDLVMEQQQHGNQSAQLTSRALEGTEVHLNQKEHQLKGKEQVRLFHRVWT